MRHPAILTLLCFTLLAVRCVIAESAAELTETLPTTKVLLIKSPELWSEPDHQSATTKTSWSAGEELQVYDRAAAPKSDNHGEAQWFYIEQGERSGWLPDAYLTAMPAPYDPEQLTTIGTERVDRTHGISPRYKPEDLVSVGPRFNESIDYKLRREAAEAHERMVAAARRDGVRLMVVSAYRSWAKQQRNYQAKLKRSGWGQRTVAKPGHSEHQLGTTVDYTDGDLDALLKPEFGKTRAGRWLREHAWAYGFAQTYTEHNREQTGYEPEPWHYRYWGLSQARTRHYEALGIDPEATDETH